MSDQDLIKELLGLEKIKDEKGEAGTIEQETALAEAPAPLTIILTLSIFFLLISKALIRAAVVIIAVPC